MQSSKIRRYLIIQSLIPFRDAAGARVSTVMFLALHDGAFAAEHLVLNIDLDGIF